MFKSVVLCIFALFSSEAYTPGNRIVCKQGTHLPSDNCQYLVGHFAFDEGECPKDKYTEVTDLDGSLTFRAHLENKEPMTCFPRLKNIYVDVKINKTSMRVPIVVNTISLTKFTFHPELTIYAMNDTWIHIEDASYVMDADTYAALAARFGPEHIQVKDFAKIGECRLGDHSLNYLNELDGCETVKGDIVIDGTLLTTRTKTRMHRLDGCLKINGTSLELKHLAFLRKVRSITCPNPPVIALNKRLCLTDVFIDTLMKAHTNVISTPHMKSFLKSRNGYKGCETVCFGEDLHDEKKNCSVVEGDLLLRSEYLPKLKSLYKIKGRLIVDGYGKEEIFKHLPNLTVVQPDDQKNPALLIRRNRILKKVRIPKSLEFKSIAKPLIAIAQNYFYRMEREEYEELLQRFKKDQLDIDFLQSGNCYFPHPIKNISALDSCEIVYGDLVLEGDIGHHNETNATIRIVTGCIRINGTLLEELPFLLHLDARSSIDCRDGHEIKNNKNLCVRKYYSIFAKTRAGKGTLRMNIGNNRYYCPVVCNHDMLVRNGMECAYMNEGFGLPPGNAEEFAPNVMSVTEVLGPIKIKYTNLTRISMFSSLKRIVVDGTKIAIEITDNYRLKHVEFPKLEAIVSTLRNSSNDSMPLIRIKDNGLYRMPLKQFKALAEKWGEDNVEIDHVGEDYSYDAGLAIGFGFAFLAGLVATIGILAWGAQTVGSQKYVPTKGRWSENEKLIRPGSDDEEGGGEPGDAMYGNQPKSGPMTAISAYLSNKFFGDMKKNESVMQKGNPTMRTRVSVGAPVTARSAMIGRKDQYYGGLKDNESAMQKNKTTEEAAEAAAEEESKVGNVTARTANIGKGAWKGAKDEESKVKPVTARTAYIGKEAWKGSKGEESKNIPLTAKTANIGKEEWKGTKATESEGKALTARTAYIGKEGWKGERKEAKGPVSNGTPATARTAMIGANKNLQKTKSAEAVAKKSK